MALIRTCLQRLTPAVSLACRFTKSMSSLYEKSIETKSTTPQLTHIVAEGNNVCAMASLGDDVFATRWDNKEVEVYNAVTLELERCLRIPGLGSRPEGLAACSSNNCLYVSDWVNSSVHRVELAGNKAVTRWSVGSGPMGLSVNSAHNVVVACYGTNKLQEYTTHGILVREIYLQKDVMHPWKVVQMSNGQFLVSHEKPVDGVSVFGIDGRIVLSYTELQGSGVGGMNDPRGLAVDKNGCILVADYGNNRILALNPSLTSAQVLPLPVDGGLRGPQDLCLNESRGRLYVGECRIAGRVLVFDNLKL